MNECTIFNKKLAIYNKVRKNRQIHLLQSNRKRFLNDNNEVVFI